MSNVLDLNKIVNESLEKIQEEKFVEQVVEQRIKKTLEDIVDDIFKSWSDFGKSLKNEIEGKLNINLEKLNMETYNQLVLNSVKEKLDEAMHIQGVEKMKAQMDELLKFNKNEYKLSELIEILKREARDSYEYEELEDSEISLHIDDSRLLAFIYFDIEEDVKDYSCKYRLVVNKDTNTINSVKINDKEFKNNVIMGGLYGLEKELFKIYASGAKIIIDKDDIDTYFGYESDY